LIIENYRQKFNQRPHSPQSIPVSDSRSIFQHISILFEEGLLSFPRSKAHLAYAVALGKCGHAEEAEAAFLQMNGRYANFEPRYQYGVFLNDAGRSEEAAGQFRLLVTEFSYLGGRERHINRPWYAKSKEALKSMTARTTGV
jgi:hypothetical protein